MGGSSLPGPLKTGPAIGSHRCSVQGDSLSWFCSLPCAQAVEGAWAAERVPDGKRGVGRVATTVATESNMSTPSGPRRAQPDRARPQGGMTWIFTVGSRCRLAGYLFVGWITGYPRATPQTRRTNFRRVGRGGSVLPLIERARRPKIVSFRGRSN